MKFLLKLLVFSISFLLINYSFSYEFIYQKSGNVVCNLTDSRSSSCVVGLYKPDSSHAFLCSFPNLFWKYLECKIVTDQFIIPINFTENNCGQSDTLFYLYYPSNSHINLDSGNYPICFDSYFKNILARSLYIGDFFIVSAYKLNNSHLSLNSSKPIPIFINITDKVFPEIKYNETRDEIITFPPLYIYFNISENKYLYICQIWVNNKLIYDFTPYCRYRSYYEKVIAINNTVCPTGPCNITYLALDLAGNLKNITVNHTAYAPCVVVDLFPKTDEISLNPPYPANYTLIITNPAFCRVNFTNVTIYFSQRYCENLVVTSSDAFPYINISSMSIGDQKNVSIMFYPLTLGRCFLDVKFTGYIDGRLYWEYTYTIPITITYKPPEYTIVVSERFIFILILLFLILFFI